MISRMSAKIRNGFTLIELLVVIVLIGILSTLILANLNSARERSRDTQRKSDLRMIKTALMMYYNACGAYPSASGGQIKGCGGTATCTTGLEDCPWGNLWEMGGTTYMKLMPKDPLDSQSYIYANINSNSFTLVSFLENMSDEAGETSRTQCVYSHVDGKNEYAVCDD